MTATKSYACGDVIQNCEPIAHVIECTEKSVRCDHCLQANNKLFLCSKCKNMYYCGKECQKNDWRFHKNECDIYASYYKLINSDHLTRLLLRLWILIDRNDKNSAQKKFRLHNGNYRTLYDMESHEQEMKRDSKRMNEFKSICNKLKECDIKYNYDTVFRLFGFIIINGYSINTIDVTNDQSINIASLGQALYPSGSYFDHSCSPNACVTFTGYRSQIRAIKPITSGEEILVNYIRLDLPKTIRKLQLKSHYYFDCVCPKCSSDDLINYKKFNELKSQLNFLIKEDINDENQFGIISTELQTIGQQIYGNYHPDYASVMMALFTYQLDYKLIRKPLNQQNRVFIENLENLIKVVFGAKHKFYQIFKESISYI